MCTILPTVVFADVDVFLASPASVPLPRQEFGITREGAGQFDRRLVKASRSSSSMPEHVHIWQHAQSKFSVIGCTRLASLSRMHIRVGVRNVVTARSASLLQTLAGFPSDQSNTFHIHTQLRRCMTTSHVGRNYPAMLRCLLRSRRLHA